MKILKLGGSIITNKRGFEELNEIALKEICVAIAANSKDLILVHGAGSFGHPHVKKFGISNSLSVARIHLACLKLSNAVCNTLADFGVAALPIHPLEFFRKVKGELVCNLDYITKALEAGFTPVLHGDVILSDDSFEVLSGDDIVIFLAEKFDAERIGFATDVEGVVVNGKIVNSFSAAMLSSIGESDKPDVTGGMRAKLEKILNMHASCKAYIFKGTAENVAKFLNGEKVGTEVVR